MLHNSHDKGCGFFTWLDCESPKQTEELIIEFYNAKKLLESENLQLRKFQVLGVILKELNSLKNELAKMKGNKKKEENKVIFKISRNVLLCGKIVLLWILLCIVFNGV